MLSRNVQNRRRRNARKRQRQAAMNAVAQVIAESVPDEAPDLCQISYAQENSQSRISVNMRGLSQRVKVRIRKFGCGNICHSLNAGELHIFFHKVAVTFTVEGHISKKILVDLHKQPNKVINVVIRLPVDILYACVGLNSVIVPASQIKKLARKHLANAYQEGYKAGLRKHVVRTDKTKNRHPVAGKNPNHRKNRNRVAMPRS